MADRWRSWGRWLVVTVLAVLGVGAAALKAFGWDWPWLVAVVAGVAAVLVLPGKILAGRIEGAAKRIEDRRHVLRAGALGGGRRRVRDYSDPTELGVHRALLPAGGDRRDAELPELVPVYVPRDRHEEIVGSLNAGRFVVVLGDSGAGKTRVAFEAVAATLPGHRLVVPERTALATAVEEMAGLRDAVLWLDDLENYLGADGLTATMISRLLSGPGAGSRVVVATLRTQELMRLDDEDDRLVGEDRRKVLARAQLIRLDRRFTDGELRRARDRSHDPCIAEALTHIDQYGLAEYLAAGPQLLLRWQNGWSPRTNPRGAALVQAAVDCRRAGYRSPLPKDLLTEIHQHYLDARGPRLHPESLDEAWTWAGTPWRDTTALLEESGNDTVTVFDYLVDHVQRASTADDHVPEPVIRAAFRHADVTDLGNVAERAYAQGRYPLAHQGFTGALERRTHTLGADHPNTLTCRNNLAEVLRGQGKLEEAAAEFRAVLEVRERVLGADHPATLLSRNNLATVLYGQGMLGGAAAEHRAVLEVRERVLGADHPDTLISRNNLATVLGDQGMLVEAAAEFRAVLQARERVLGADHPATLGSRNNLATVLYGQGMLVEAAAEHRAVLEAHVRVLGADHPSTLASRNNLALVLHDQGQLVEAAAEFRAVLQVSERVLGADHPDTLASRSNLAVVLYGQGKLDEAVTEHRAVLRVRVRVLGADHPATLGSRNNLATVLYGQGMLVEAAAEHRAVLQVCERVLGADHPHTLTSRSNLAGVLRDQGKFGEAAAEHRAVLEVRERVLGADHPATLLSRNNLATVLYGQGMLVEAVAEFRAVLQVRERVLGADHPDTLSSRNNLALVLRYQDKLDETAADSP